MSNLNNEQIGISAEVAIADIFGVSVESSYRARAVPEIVSSIKQIVADIFVSRNIPEPIRHIAADQNPIDFKLKNGNTLSVKTNKQKLGKVAPQKIGQASSRTWFLLLAEFLGLDSDEIPENYPAKARLFKQIALTRSDELLKIYWENLFDCNYLVHIYNVVDKDDAPTYDPKFIVSAKMRSPIWEKSKITFTKPTLEEWNESNTIKYDGVSIGEYQIHNNRDNFKFRFNMKAIDDLIQSGRITIS